MTTSILITGGFGYVGGRLTHYLANLPNLKIYVTSRKKRVTFSSFPQVQSLCLDFPTESLGPLLEEIDTIIHLAALNEIDCERDPTEAILVNTIGTYRILQEAIKAKVKRFIYFSTAHVYGSPLQGVLEESQRPRPLHPYSLTHFAAEELIREAHNNEKIAGVILRLSNSFGAPLIPDVNRWTLLVNDLCQQLVKTKKLVLKSHGLQKRDFISLSDVCRAVEHLLFLDSSRLGDGIFNLGGENSLRIIEMVEKIAERSSKVLGFRPLIERPSTPLNQSVDEPSLIYRIEKLKKTGFFLESKLDQELDNILLFCRDHFGASI